jgi:hypothetical protein
MREGERKTTATATSNATSSSNNATTATASSATILAQSAFLYQVYPYISTGTSVPPMSGASTPMSGASTPRPDSGGPPEGWSVRPPSQSRRVRFSLPSESPPSESPPSQSRAFSDFTHTLAHMALTMGDPKPWPEGADPGRSFRDHVVVVYNDRAAGISSRYLFAVPPSTQASANSTTAPTQASASSTAASTQASTSASTQASSSTTASS